MVWGVNLGYNNITNAVNMAKAIMRAFSLPSVQSSGVILERIEVGQYRHSHARTVNIFLTASQETRRTYTAAMDCAPRTTGRWRFTYLIGNLWPTRSSRPWESPTTTAPSLSREQRSHHKSSLHERFSHWAS